MTDRSKWMLVASICFALAAAWNAVIGYAGINLIALTWPAAAAVSLAASVSLALVAFRSRRP